MKKTISVAVIFALILSIALIPVNAATSQTLADELYAKCKVYGVDESIRIRIDRYLTDYPISDTDANRILDLAKEADQIMKDSGTMNYFELPTSTKLKLRDLGSKAAGIAGATVVYKTNTIEFYRDGKLIDVVIIDRANVLVYTGNNTNVILIASSIILAVALTAITLRVVNKKKVLISE